MATEDYVPCTGDDWYERRRDDDEGRFWRKVAKQSPYAPDDDSTLQGIYCLTADGQLLACKNAGQDPAAMRDALRSGLVAWKKLPESKRLPGAVHVADPGPPDPHFVRTPPVGGAVIKVFTRTLEVEGPENYIAAACSQGAGGEAARDHLWLTREELRSLLPANPREGASIPVPTKLVDRIARFHLVDNTRGEPPHWQREEIRSAKMTLTVEHVSSTEISLRLDGSVLLSTNADAARAERGYDVQLLGHIALDRLSGALERFDVVAFGNHWGEGPFTAGARPGQTPLGISFELVRKANPSDLVPPQGARIWHDYMGP